MSTQARCDFLIQFGKSYWKFSEFRTNPVSKDAYWIFPIPDVGLHLSIHSPKPPTYPNWHLHWRSEPLGIDEDINDGVFSPENCVTWAMEWLENFRYYEPSNEERVTVFPLITDAQRIETMGKRERTIIDVGSFIQAIGNGAFYRTKVKRLPLLMKAKPYGDIGVCALSENGMILPIDSETMIEIDPRSIHMEKLMRSSLGSILDPMTKAIATIQRTRPNSFQRWFPISDAEDFLKKTTDPLRHLRPKIIDF